MGSDRKNEIANTSGRNGFPPQGVWARPTGKRPRGRPRTHWREYVSRLAWESLGVPPEELEEVAGDRDVWVSLLRLHPTRDPTPGEAVDNGWLDGTIIFSILQIVTEEQSLQQTETDQTQHQCDKTRHRQQTGKNKRRRTKTEKKN